MTAVIKRLLTPVIPPGQRAGMRAPPPIIVNQYSCLKPNERIINQNLSMKRELPRLTLRAQHAGHVNLACFGPSLEETWRSIKGPVMTVSGSHDFLIERGIIPDWHVECDPRPHKARFLTRPNKATHYIIASCCDPSMFDQLEGHRVSIWHNMEPEPELHEWVNANDPDGMCVGGGSTVGERALSILGILGYRNFRIFGMDCSFRDDQHADEHHGSGMKTITIACGGRDFKTSHEMFHSASEVVQMVLSLRGKSEIVFYGDGLVANLLAVAGAHKLMKEVA